MLVVLVQVLRNQFQAVGASGHQGRRFKAFRGVVEPAPWVAEGELPILQKRASRLLLLAIAQSRSASTGTSRCPTGFTASRASSSVTTPSRLGWFSSANVTCVAKIWSSSLTTVQPMSTGTELPSASRDRAA